MTNKNLTVEEMLAIATIEAGMIALKIIQEDCAKRMSTNDIEGLDKAIKISQNVLIITTDMIEAKKVLKLATTVEEKGIAELNTFISHLNKMKKYVNLTAN